mmetsp:Transcript_13056/g.32240  ORF Transcript_13056/g.32240 Transcript_13056/m.32240 type:complete len:217 (+) Transcript_13056:1053-1703(+)
MPASEVATGPRTAGGRGCRAATTKPLARILFDFVCPLPNHIGSTINAAAGSLWALLPAMGTLPTIHFRARLCPVPPVLVKALFTDHLSACPLRNVCAHQRLHHVVTTRANVTKVRRHSVLIPLNFLRRRRAVGRHETSGNLRRHGTPRPRRHRRRRHRPRRLTATPRRTLPSKRRKPFHRMHRDAQPRRIDHRSGRRLLRHPHRRAHPRHLLHLVH